MYLLEPVESLEDNLKVFNNKLVPQEEIKSIIANNFDNAQAFIKYNPLDFSKKIKNHPLIKNVLTRTNAFSSQKFSIIVTEEKPWAVYRNKIFNDNFEIIKDFDSQIDQQDFASIDEIYNSILNDSSSIIQIKSNEDLVIKDFKKLKKITAQINERLGMISAKQIQKLNIIDGELSLGSSELKLVLGLYKDKVKKKIKRLDHMLNKVKANISKIEYIDLSLDTNEAIIGLNADAKSFNK